MVYAFRTQADLAYFEDYRTRGAGKPNGKFKRTLSGALRGEWVWFGFI